MKFSRLSERILRQPSQVAIVIFRTATDDFRIRGIFRPGFLPISLGIADYERENF